MVESLMSHGLFYGCPYYVSGSGNISVVLLSMQGQKTLGFHQNNFNLCSEDEWRSYWFGTTWGWVINDRIFIFGWTNYFMYFWSTKCSLDEHKRPLSKPKGSELFFFPRSCLWCNFYMFIVPHDSFSNIQILFAYLYTDIFISNK